MRIAISFFNGRISPLLDASQCFLLLELDGTQEKERREIELKPGKPMTRFHQIANLKPDVLICGAISRALERLLSTIGLRVILNTCGPVDEVLEAFLKGQLTEQAYLLPGCCGKRRRARGLRSGKFGFLPLPKARTKAQTQPKTKGVSMKIAISAEGKTLDSNVDPRFGRAKWFILYDTETKDFEAIDNQQVLNLPQGAGIQAAQQIIDRKVAGLLTGHCGPNAYRTLKAAGVSIFVGVTGTIEQAIEQYKSGQLKPSADPNVEGHW